MPVDRQDQVVALPVLGEISFRVLDDTVCPKQAQSVQILLTAHAIRIPTFRVHRLFGTEPINRALGLFFLSVLDTSSNFLRIVQP